MAQRRSARRRSGQSAALLQLNLLATPLRALIQRAPVSLLPDTPIRAVAAHMRTQRVSSVLLVEHGARLGLVLSDDDDEAAHGDWFKAFARFVCDRLAACGYIHCPGERVAMTGQWRQPRALGAVFFSVGARPSPWC